LSQNGASSTPISERDRDILRSFARRIDGSDAGAHNNLGVLYYNKDLFDEAKLPYPPHKVGEQYNGKPWDLATYQVGDGYKLYNELTPDDTRKMTEAVDAVAEPVSQVAGVVTS